MISNSSSFKRNNVIVVWDNDDDSCTSEGNAGLGALIVVFEHHQPTGNAASTGSLSSVSSSSTFDDDSEASSLSHIDDACDDETFCSEVDDDGYDDLIHKDSIHPRWTAMLQDREGNHIEDEQADHRDVSQEILLKNAVLQQKKRSIPAILSLLFNTNQLEAREKEAEDLNMMNYLHQAWSNEMGRNQANRRVSELSRTGMFRRPSSQLSVAAQ